MELPSALPSPSPPPPPPTKKTQKNKQNKKFTTKKIAYVSETEFSCSNIKKFIIPLSSLKRKLSLHFRKRKPALLIPNPQKTKKNFHTFLKESISYISENESLHFLVQAEKIKQIHLRKIYYSSGNRSPEKCFCAF